MKTIQLPDQIIKLGTPAHDEVTNSDGMATHLLVNLDGAVYYTFQPTGLNPKTGAPLDHDWVASSRVTGKQMVPCPKLPLEVLGSKVTDIASGYTGTAVDLVYHINGCVHVDVQSDFKQESGETAKDVNFDIRRLTGDKVPKFTEQERDEDIKRAPSPAGHSKFRP